MSLIIITAVLIMLICFGWMSYLGISYGKKWISDFELNVSFSEEQAAEGDTLYLYETITNRKKMILPAVCVKFKASRYLHFEDMASGTVSDYYYRNEVLSVHAFEQVRRKLKVKCMQRGEYIIDEAEVVGNDYFLRQRYVEKRELNARLIVYPALVDMKRIMPVFQKGYGELATRVPMFEDSFEYVGVRQYQPGDTMNRIHWKASAKTGNWQVRTSAYQAAEPALVVLNLESPGTFINRSAMEENIRIAYSIVSMLDSRGIETTLVVNGTEKLRFTGNGKGHIAKVRHGLARISYETQICTGEQMLRRELEQTVGNEHLFFVSAAAKSGIQEQLELFLRRKFSITWIAAVIGGEDDTKGLKPEFESILYRWKG